MFLSSDKRQCTAAILYGCLDIKALCGACAHGAILVSSLPEPQRLLCQQALMFFALFARMLELFLQATVHACCDCASAVPGLVQHLLYGDPAAGHRAVRIEPDGWCDVHIARARAAMRFCRAPLRAHHRSAVL